MKIIDKIKNFFYDDEEIEISDSKDKKKEPPKIINKEKPSSLKEEKENDDGISERELFKAESTFKFPIIFEEEDLVEQQHKRVNVLEIENTKIKSESLTIQERKIFIPSPIISPIYGVIEPLIDDNKSQAGEKIYDKKGRINIDSVINKVYQQPKAENKKHKLEEKDQTRQIDEGELDLFKNIDNLKEEVDNKQTTLDDKVRIKSIDELLESTDEQDFYTLIDSMYENVEEEELN